MHSDINEALGYDVAFNASIIYYFKMLAPMHGYVMQMYKTEDGVQ